jgi:hypothetical protein
MNRREATERLGLIVALAAVQAGCYDPDAGTIRPEPRAVGQMDRAPSGPPPRTSGSKPSRKPADTNDLSPIGRGRGTRP